jgi:hypothetical protein
MSGVSRGGHATCERHAFGSVSRPTGDSDDKRDNHADNDENLDFESARSTVRGEARQLLDPIHLLPPKCLDEFSVA